MLKLGHLFHCSLKTFFCSGFFLLGLGLLPCLPAQAKIASDPHPSWSYLQRKLKLAHFKSSFIRELKKNYEEDTFAKVLELNLLLYLRDVDVHQPQVTDQAVSNILDFIQSNESTFALAEKKYHVPRTVVASLLWIESRHGENLGNFHVPSVYLHLLQANRKPMISYLRASVDKYTDKPTPEQLRELTKRTRKKSQWALKELHALEKAHEQKSLNIKELKGSYAGAFGLPQFIPSSYVEWAQSSSPKKSPDLTKPADAIHSVAFYLKDNGWKYKKTSSYTKALLRYNNSTDYANAILNLAEKTEEKRDPKSKGLRLPANK